MKKKRSPRVDKKSAALPLFSVLLGMSVLMAANTNVSPQPASIFGVDFSDVFSDVNDSINDAVDEATNVAGCSYSWTFDMAGEYVYSSNDVSINVVAGDDGTAVPTSGAVDDIETNEVIIASRYSIPYDELTSFSDIYTTYNSNPAIVNDAHVFYQISPDGTNWYYFNYMQNRWMRTRFNSYVQSNPASTINLHLNEFDDAYGSGRLWWRAYLEIRRVVADINMFGTHTYYVLASSYPSLDSITIGCTARNGGVPPSPDLDFDVPDFSFDTPDFNFDDFLTPDVDFGDLFPDSGIPASDDSDVVDEDAAREAAEEAAEEAIDAGGDAEDAADAAREAAEAAGEDEDEDVSDLFGDDLAGAGAADDASASSEEDANSPGENNAPEFTDVPADNPHASAIGELHRRGIVNGYDETHFGPNYRLRRGELLKIALNGAGIDTSEYIHAENPYSDVPNDHSLKQYILYAYHNNIARGYGNGKFGPDSDTTSAEAAKMLLNINNIEPEAAPAGVTYNLPATSDLIGFIHKSMQMNILYDAQQFAAMAPVLRDYTAEMMYRILMTNERGAARFEE